MSNNEKIPKIRFKGFTEDWEQRKLEDVSKFSQGFQVDLNKQEYSKSENNIRFIRIVDYTQKTEDLRYIVNDTKYNLIKNDDVIVVRYGATAGFVGHGITGVLANNMFKIDPINEINKNYLYTFMNMEKIYKILNNSNGSSAMPALNFASVGNIEISFPKYEEQTKIAMCLENLDNLITLHQRKCDKLINVKKSMLEKMFPQNDEKIPKIRFKGFTEDWEQRKLSDMSIYKNGTGHEDKQSNTGRYELINLNSVSIDGGLKTSGKFIDDSNETLQIDDLVMVLSDVGHGDLLGRVAIIPENDRFVLNQRVALLRPKENVFPKFLYTCINAGQKYFKTNGAGSSQLNISKDVVENFEPFVPKKEEQKEISKYFENLDNLITLHQRKCI